MPATLAGVIVGKSNTVAKSAGCWATMSLSVASKRWDMAFLVPFPDLQLLVVRSGDVGDYATLRSGVPPTPYSAAIR